MVPASHTCCNANAMFQLPWVFPSHSHDLAWDTTMCADTTRVASLREAMARAFRAPLVPAQQQQILTEFEADGKLVFHCGLTPQRLPELVENNPGIAAEALLKLMVCTGDAATPTAPCARLRHFLRQGSSRIGEYLDALVHMDMSLHSMEVVNRLTTAVEMPADFVHLYISNCISSCEATKARGGHGQTQRRGRLLTRLSCIPGQVHAEPPGSPGVRVSAEPHPEQHR